MDTISKDFRLYFLDLDYSNLTDQLEEPLQLFRHEQSASTAGLAAPHLDPPLSEYYLFHINRFEGELLARDDLDTDRTAIGAGKLLAIGMIFLEASHALKLRWNNAEV